MITELVQWYGEKKKTISECENAVSMLFPRKMFHAIIARRFNTIFFMPTSKAGSK